MGGRAEARCKGHAFGARLVSQGRPARRRPGRFFLSFACSESVQDRSRPSASGSGMFTDRAGQRPIDPREIARPEQPDMHEPRVEIVEVSSGARESRAQAASSPHRPRRRPPRTSRTGWRRRARSQGCRNRWRDPRAPRSCPRAPAHSRSINRHARGWGRRARRDSRRSARPGARCGQAAARAGSLPRAPAVP